MDTRDSAKSLDSKFEKVKCLWYEEGDVVVRAGNKEFRLYGTILSAASTFFLDKLRLGQVPQADSEGGVMYTTKTENDPFTVIDLPDKDPLDAVFFFSAIFNSDFYKPPPMTYRHSDTVVMLRLAEEYDAPMLVPRALAHLDKLFPMEYEILETLANTNKSDRQMLDLCFELLYRVDRIQHLQWLVPSIIYFALNLSSLPDIIKASSFRRLAPKFWKMIIECGMLNAMRQGSVESREGTISFVQVQIFALEGDPFWEKCWEYVQKSEERSRNDLWNQHVVLCGFESWHDVAARRTEAFNDGAQSEHMKSVFEK